MEAPIKSEDAFSEALKVVGIAAGTAAAGVAGAVQEVRAKEQAKTTGDQPGLNAADLDARVWSGRDDPTGMIRPRLRSINPRYHPTGARREELREERRGAS